MKNRYRIKVEERQNGDVLYIPQVGHPMLRTGVLCYLITDWYNIIDSNEHSKTVTISYHVESEAKQKIEDYKNNILKEEGKEVKSVKYIDID